jgi:aminoglycoside phosphotransferase (APT) family kinase protein
MPPLDPTLDRFLREHALARPDEHACWTPLSGGVSSDIWRVDLPERSLCVKRALPTLRVAAEWKAPISRNAYEWAWMCFAAEHQPRAVPHPLAHDSDAGLFAMEYLPPSEHPVWKQQLLDGEVNPRTAAEVGHVIALLHEASAGRADLSRNFDTLGTFHTLRLEPYLLATALRHPDISAALHTLAERTGNARIALVHGDVSPKNILVGPHGPVILDAECAWYGDPAFDLAFCLTHLLLKCLVQPHCTAALIDCFIAMTTHYLAVIHFESPEGLEQRAARLLAALLLARIDGKSPVEYLVRDPPKQQWVRDFARPLVGERPSTLAKIAHAWRQRLDSVPLA